MKNKVFRLLAMVLVLALCFTACGKSSSSDTSSVNNSQTTEDSTVAPDTTDNGEEAGNDTKEEDSTANDTTAEDMTDADSKDNISDTEDSSDPSEGQDSKEQVEVKEPYYSILVVSTGSTSTDSNTNSIGAIEQAISEKCPNYEIRRAFSNQDVVTELNAKDISVDNVRDALDHCVADGVTHLGVQPTYLMFGEEYDALKQMVNQYKDKFEKIELGDPLFQDDTDYMCVVGLMSNFVADYDDGKTAFVYVGNEPTNKMYKKFQKILKSDWCDNCFIGSLEDNNSFEEVLRQVKKGGYKKVMLIPFLVSVDDEAMVQINGKAENTWKSMFMANGFKKVRSLNLGLAEIQGIIDIYAQRASRLTGTLH